MITDERMKKGVVWIILIFSVLSVLLLLAAWYAAGIVPDLMTRNYRSIQYASQMEGALVNIFLDEVNGKEPDSAAVARFENNLKLERANFTEENEEEIVNALSTDWRAFRDQPMSPAIESFQKVLSGIKRVVDVNEQAMHALEQKAVSLRYGVLFGGVLGFVLVLFYALEIVLYTNVNKS